MDDLLAEISSVLSELQKSQDLSIIKLSEPFSLEYCANNAKRESDVSADAHENTSVASLKAELEHYKDLFSKLRFSYVEQVTKEKFLRAIVSDPPFLVQPHENSELEAQLKEVKANLKAQKDEVAQLTKELESQGRDLAERHERITLQTTELSHLPTSLSTLTSTIAHLHSTTIPPSRNPDLNLPLLATLALKAQRDGELAQLNAQIAELQDRLLPRKTHELAELESELRELEVQRQGTVAAAREARRKREGWGDAEELEEKGRWARACGAALRGMLEVEG
ncbi:MAG: hypothetical protein Q9165_008314 [Trypethelium subeluteriae]